MVKSKSVRNKGKTRLSEYFKGLKEGDKVAVTRDLGIKASFPQRIIGSTGKVTGTRGKYSVIEIKEGNKNRTFIIHPVHLKRLK